MTRTLSQKRIKQHAVFWLRVSLKVAYYSFQKKKIKILKSVKLKQQLVSTEVLVTAVDVKHKFTLKTEFKSRKKINTVTELLAEDWKLDT